MLKKINKKQTNNDEYADLIILLDEYNLSKTIYSAIFICCSLLNDLENITS